MEEEKRRILQLVSKKYTFDILKSLDAGEKRFKDLRQACSGEKMRAQRLRELEDAGLVSVTIIRAVRRPVSIYRLSKKGKLILDAAKTLGDSIRL